MNHVGKTFLLSVVTTAALAACGGPPTPPPDAPSPGEDAAGTAASATPDTPTEGAGAPGAGADLVASKCVACHERPAPGKLTKDELGAKLDADHETVELTPEQRQTIVDHLAKP